MDPARKGTDEGTKAKSSAESRRVKRARRRIMVRYGIGEEKKKTAFTRNLSSTGVFLQTNMVYPPGTTVELELRFPRRTVSMWARVVWAKKVPPQLAHILECGMGLRFIDPTAEWLSFYEDWKRRVGAD